MQKVTYDSTVVTSNSCSPAACHFCQQHRKTRAMTVTYKTYREDCSWHDSHEALFNLRLIERPSAAILLPPKPSVKVRCSLIDLVRWQAGGCLRADSWLPRAAQGLPPMQSEKAQRCSARSGTSAGDGSRRQDLRCKLWQQAWESDRGLLKLGALVGPRVTIMCWVYLRLLSLQGL